MLKREIKIIPFVAIMSLLNFLFFHYRFFSFAFDNFDYKSFGGILFAISLVTLVFVFNAFTYYILLYLSHFVGKFLLSVTFIINAIASYFINIYNVIIDEGMISNVINTNTEEAGSFFSFKLILYVILFGVLPVIYILRAKIITTSFKRFIITFSVTLSFIVGLILANAPHWLWIDKHATTLGALVMPWSYTVNTVRYYIHEHQRNKQEILLPDATIGNSKKAVMVLVIGESARSRNFSLYGYNKNTNPLLTQIPHLFHFDATSCATYTIMGVKCILEHKQTDNLYEILPNYLYRNDVEVIWRTTNWGEPPIHIANYMEKEAIPTDHRGWNRDYDEVLLSGLPEQIRESTKNKVLVILHSSTSHGPTYSKKYPPRFEQFSPVCHSVELNKCSSEELINAYDNTIVYTDYLLHSLIGLLKELDEYDSSMMFVSDHGESLGEKNLYMHGVPMSIAPREQYEIPFIVWVSDSTRRLKPMQSLTQHYVFHSVLKFLSVESPIYDEEMNIFE